MSFNAKMSEKNITNERDTKGKVRFIICAFIATSMFFNSTMASFAFDIFKKKNSKFVETVNVENEISGADSEMTLSIDDCIKIALENDPNIKISENLGNIAKSRVGQAKADYFPNLSAGGGYTVQDNNSNMNYPGTSNNSNNYSQINLSVNQLIWNFGKSAAKINMQKYNFESGGYDHENTVLNTVYRVKLAYFAVLAARANEDIYERSVKINELHYERTNAFFQEGLQSKIDVVNAEVYLTDAKIQLLNAENKYNTALIALNNAMYYTDAPKYQIKNTENFNFHKTRQTRNEINISDSKGTIEQDVMQDSGNIIYKKDSDGEDTAILTSGIEKHDILQNFVFAPYVISMNDSIEEAYRNRPDLKSLIMVENASKESLKAVKRMYMPELGVSGGYSYRNMDDVTNNSLNATLGLNFTTVNVMDIKNRIDEAKYYLEIAGDNVDLLKKNIYFEVQNNFVNMVELERRIPLMGKKVSQTLENFELADGRYTVGLGNFIELQDAQINYNNAQLSYVQSVFDYNVAKAQLEKSMGVKWNEI